MSVRTSSLLNFYKSQKGPCIVVGLGPNLKLTPPTLFSFPSFGVNTIYKQAEWDWKPTYYVGVDERLRVEDGKQVIEAYKDIPKFFPSPDWDMMSGENIYRFNHRQGSILLIGGQSPTDRDAMTRGITYFRIMDAVFQIAAWMGFDTILCIGFYHKDRNKLFWGTDEGEPESDFRFEEMGYKTLSQSLPCKILNISADTHVPEDVLQRDDWRNWADK